MEFLSNSEKKIANSFKKKGYIISKAENRQSLTYIKNKIISFPKKNNIRFQFLKKYIVKVLNRFNLI